jgi:hypothetical protein
MKADEYHALMESGWITAADHQKASEDLKEIEARLKVKSAAQLEHLYRFKALNATPNPLGYY